MTSRRPRSVLPARRSWRPLGLQIAVWTIACCAGWAAAYLWLGGPTGVGLVPSWSGTAVVVLLSGGVLGLVIERSVRSMRIERPDRLALLTGIGWGVANSAGWSLDVEIGGPMTGLVTGVALAAAVGGVSPGRAVAVGVVGLAGPVLGRLAFGDLPPLPGLALSLIAALAAVIGARALIAPAMPLRPIIALTLAGGLAWVGAYFLVAGLVPATAAALSTAVEVLLAVTIGAAAIGIELRGRTAESPAVVVLRWVAAAVVGLAGGAAIAIVLSAVVGGGGPIVHLGAGMNIGLGVTAWVAALPTLIALCREGREVTALKGSDGHT